VQALFVVINEPDILQDVITGLLEEGITTATIIESQGMGRVVMDKMSVFAGFRDLWSGNLGYGHTIFAIIDDEQVDQVIKAVKDILASEASKSRGVLFTLPVGRFEKLSD
jgi:nitrogen regulatory protein P-II 1